MSANLIYKAPELLNGINYDKKTDIWSIGIILYKLIYNRMPLYEKNLPDKSIYNDNINDNINDILKLILEKNSIKRININQLFEINYLKKYKQLIIINKNDIFIINNLFDTIILDDNIIDDNIIYEQYFKTNNLNLLKSYNIDEEYDII